MAPDAPYFLHLPVPQYATHSLPGVVTIDLAMAVVLVAIWHAWLAPAAVDLAPGPVRARISLAPRTWRGVRRDFGWRALLSASIAGGLTHVAWDAFTHPDRWGVRQIPWLEAMHGRLPGFAWAQYASGLAGGAILALGAIMWWRATAPQQARSAEAATSSLGAALPPALPARARFLWIAAMFAAGLAGCMAGALVALQAGGAGLGYHAATWGGTAGGLVAAGASLWLARTRPARALRPS